MNESKETSVAVDRQAYFVALGKQRMTLATEAEALRAKAEQKMTAGNFLNGQIELEGMFQRGLKVFQASGQNDIPIEWNGKPANLNISEVNNGKSLRTGISFDETSSMRISIYDTNDSQTGLADIGLHQSEKTLQWTVNECKTPERYFRKGGNNGVRWGLGADLFDTDGGALNGTGLSDTTMKIGEMLEQFSIPVSTPAPIT